MSHISYNIFNLKTPPSSLKFYQLMSHTDDFGNFLRRQNFIPPRRKQSQYFLTFMEPRNRFQGMNSASLFSLADRYDNPIPTRFLAPIDCLKILAQAT